MQWLSPRWPRQSILHEIWREILPGRVSSMSWGGTEVVATTSSSMFCLIIWRILNPGTKLNWPWTTTIPPILIPRPASSLIQWVYLTVFHDEPRTKRVEINLNFYRSPWSPALRPLTCSLTPNLVEGREKSLRGLDAGGSSWRREIGKKFSLTSFYFKGIGGGNHRSFHLIQIGKPTTITRRIYFEPSSSRAY